MKTFTRIVLLSLVACLWTAAGQAADQKADPEKPKDGAIKNAAGDADKAIEPGVHRMEIYNGPIRTVAYVYGGLSPSEAAAVRELERSENENILASEMLNLRTQYVAGERTFDAQRRFTQQQLFGFSGASMDTLVPTGTRRGQLGFISTGGGYGGMGYGWGGYNGMGYSGFGYNNGGYGMTALNAAGGFTSVDSVGLGQGVGDEGRIKTEMARTIASQATPEYAAKAAESLTAASTKAATYPVVRDSLNLKSSPFALVDSTVAVTLVLNGKAEKFEGKVLGEQGDWLVLETKEGKRRILKSAIVDLLEKNQNQ
jgi:hypothetical protein